jgi:hypothetical protein
MGHLRPISRPGSSSPALLNQRPLSGVEQTSIGRCKMSNDAPRLGHSMGKFAPTRLLSDVKAGKIGKMGVSAGEHSAVPIRRWFRPDGVGVKLGLTLSASEL